MRPKETTLRRPSVFQGIFVFQIQMLTSRSDHRASFRPGSEIAPVWKYLVQDRRRGHEGLPWRQLKLLWQCNFVGNITYQIFPITIAPGNMCVGKVEPVGSGKGLTFRYEKSGINVIFCRCMWDTCQWDNMHAVLFRCLAWSAIVETYQEGRSGAISGSPCTQRQRMATLDDPRKLEVGLGLWQNWVLLVPSSVCQGEVTLPREMTSWTKSSRK